MLAALKVQHKITLLYFILSSLVLLLLSAAIFYFVHEFEFEDFYKRLEARVNIHAQIALYPSESNKDYLDLRNHFLERLDDERTIILRNDAIPKRDQLQNEVVLPLDFFEMINKRGKARFEFDGHFYAGSRFKTTRGEYLVIVSAQNPYGFRELAFLRNILIAGLFISALIILLSGKIFSHYIFIPVRIITNKVKGITANNLHERLEIVGGNDELSELAKTFNNMLNRLETAFETQNTFVSNASHELKTPLTIISTETELLLNKAGIDELTRTTIETVQAEAAKLNKILTGLLGLAQSGFDGKKQQWTKVRADELLWEVRESVIKIHPESRISIDLDDLPEDPDALCITGNQQLLKLALSNLVMNACKYSDYLPVSIKLRYHSGIVTVAITDKGIGIPLTDIEKIFIPFFRASNTADYEGHGLGLPLALNIIRQHFGTLSVNSCENSGTQIIVHLPSARAEPDSNLILHGNSNKILINSL